MLESLTTMYNLYKRYILTFCFIFLVLLALTTIALVPVIGIIFSWKGNSSSTLKYLPEALHWDNLTSVKENERKFKFYVIPKNKLRVIIVSDPKTKYSAAAISVGVGSTDDPHSHLGLAHLCEHMLSMGSKKYPDFNTYFNFVHNYDGDINAETTYEETQYHFKISSDYLFDALDILPICLLVLYLTKIYWIKR